MFYKFYNPYGRGPGLGSIGFDGLELKDISYFEAPGYYYDGAGALPANYIGFGVENPNSKYDTDNLTNQPRIYF